MMVMVTKPWLSLAFSMPLTALALLACSSDQPAQGLGASGGAAPNAGASASGGSGGALGSGGASALAGAGAAGIAMAGNAGSGGAPPNSGFDAMLTATALAADRSVGVEWNAVAGASAYKVYFAEGAAPTQASMNVEVMAPRAAFVHRALTNGTAYHYAVSAVVSGQESKLSLPAMARPAGEWSLEELGDGQIDDISTGMAASRIPVEKRVHVLLFAEGYQQADLSTFHSDADHGGERESDVDGWIDYVFGLSPYRDYREAFVVWTIARASNTHFDGADTAFMVPVSDSATGNISGTGETATRAWEAIELLPVPPSDFSGEGFANARTHVASFLLFDAQRGRAGVSGRMLGLSHPTQNQRRIAAAFGVGHAHEFTHAFSSLRDEYIELDNDAPQTSETSNVVATNSCSQVPWSHLLAGGPHNAATEQLVGAFGTPEQGYHPELICLMNGTHDNAVQYGGDGLLRDDERLCNFCREMTAYRIHSRAGIVEDDETGFATWKAAYRPKFFEKYPFQVPPVVPQTNNVRNPAQGTAVYEACSDALQVSRTAAGVVGTRTPRPHGCVLEE